MKSFWRIRKRDGKRVVRECVQYEIKKKAVDWINTRIALNKLRKVFNSIAQQAALCGRDRIFMRTGNTTHLSHKKLRQV